MSKASEKAAAGDTTWLETSLLCLAAGCDNDALRDGFEDEMDEDGYFTPLPEDAS